MNRWQFAAIFFSIGTLRDLQYPEIHTGFVLCAAIAFIVGFFKPSDK